MTEYILIGGGFALAAALQPGPLQAFLLSRVTAVGWRRTLPAALAPVLSDGPIAVLMLLILNRTPDGMERILMGTGGLVLLFLALRSFQAWRRDDGQRREEKGRPPRTLLQAVVVNALNPGPYIGWSLVLGPQAVKAWQVSAAHATALVAAFYITMVTTLALLILLLGTTSWLGPQGRRSLLLVSTVALATLGGYQILYVLVR